MNDPAQAKTLCESGDLGPSKPNPHPSLSAFPVWYLTVEMMEHLTGTKDSASVGMDTSLTKEEYQQVAESMRGAASSQPKKKAKQAPYTATARKSRAERTERGSNGENKSAEEAEGDL